jgi:hypothetical protein
MKQGGGIMRRKGLSDQELEKVIRLRHAGTSWLRIQNETGIHRRTAKRAYENWQRNQSSAELKEARKIVAAEAFRKHMDSLITLATSFVASLGVPPSPDIKTDATQFLSGLWQSDLLQRWRYASIESKEFYQPHQDYPMRDLESNIRENKLLFESLQAHTRGTEVRWDALDEWSGARDNCIKVLSKLRQEVSKVVDNYLNLERRLNLIGRIKEQSVDDKPVERMKEAVFKAVWQGVREDKLDQELIRMVERSSESQGVLKVADETLLILKDKSLMEMVVRICNLAANNLNKGDIVRSLQDEVHIMKTATGALRETLDPLRLTPMILRTRCDLCPA